MHEARCYAWTMLAVAMLAVGTGSAAYAQERSVTARVTYVAGQNVYLDAGRDQGILPGDTLRVFRDDAFAGRLAVVSSIADRSVMTFADTPFAVTRGTELQVQVPALPGEETPPEEADEEAETEPSPPVVVRQEPGAAQPLEAERVTRQTARPRVTGRVMLSVNALRSSTRWATPSAGTTTRTFVTPSMNLHLAVRDLPHGLRLRTRLRADYRYTSARAIDPALSLRAYEVLLEKDFERFSVQAGRFSNRYASYSGYWDGALVHVGTRRAGFGTALGFMPNRSNEGFSAAMPRYAGFAHVELGERGGVRYAANVSFNEIRPTNDLLAHRFAGLTHTVRWQSLALRHDLQLDRDPETGRWVASRLQVRGSVAPARGLRLHARYTIRRPYSIYRVQRVIAYRRDQATAGLSVQLGRATVGGTVAFNYIDDAVEGRISDGRTVSGYVQVPQTGVLALSLSSTISYWQDDEGSSFFLNTGVARRMGRVQTRLTYQFYRTATLADPLLTHAVTAHAVVPLSHRFYASSQVRLQQSATLRSIAFYTSLWVTL